MEQISQRYFIAVKRMIIVIREILPVLISRQAIIKPKIKKKIARAKVITCAGTYADSRIKFPDTAEINI